MQSQFKAEFNKFELKFFLLLDGCYTKVKEPSLVNYSLSQEEE